jgi:uncharacterized protein YdeI (YjbR/CyaY-like superfamily)
VTDPEPIFFDGPEAFREWLAANHETASEVVVGFYKKATGKQTMTWSQAVDQALCFGWIDSVRKSIDETSYANRFTPRKPKSNWSAVNVKRVGELIELGLMTPAGRKAFEAREEDRTAVYSYEQRPQDLPPEYERELRKNARAARFWRAQPAGYRKAATWWVVSAKREDTRLRRLAALIRHSSTGERIPPLTPPAQR